LCNEPIIEEDEDKGGLGEDAMYCEGKCDLGYIVNV